jgi:UDPglucose 6-dehydrogenase
MNIDRVGIIGQGFVGTALKEAFFPHFEVRTHDKFRKDLSTHDFISCCKGCDAVFVCVPTPMRPDGSCDTSIVETVCDDIDYEGIHKIYPPHPTQGKIIVIKSTVPPETTQEINSKTSYPVVFNPEFLIERTATEDFKNTSRVILGGPSIATGILNEFYLKVFPKAEIVETDSTTAELVKYITNCFLATKVSLANEFAAMCSKLGVDYSQVIKYATEDERLGKTHWAVPGPDGKKGFGGSCFPKDINALIHYAQRIRTHPHTLIGYQQGGCRTYLQPDCKWQASRL